MGIFCGFLSMYAGSVYANANASYCYRRHYATVFWILIIVLVSLTLSQFLVLLSCQSTNLKNKSLTHHHSLAPSIIQLHHQNHITHRGLIPPNRSLPTKHLATRNLASRHTMPTVDPTVTWADRHRWWRFPEKKVDQNGRSWLIGNWSVKW